MKFLILAACLATASAEAQGFFGLQAHPNGAITPLDEPRVAAARAEHLSNKFGGLAFSGYGYPYGYASNYAAYAPYTGHVHNVGGVFSAPTYTVSAPTYAAAPASFISAPSVATYTPNYYPNLVSHSNGAVVPFESAAITAAREQHFAAHQAAVQAPAPYVPTASVAVPAVPTPAPQAYVPTPQASPAYVPAPQAAPAYVPAPKATQAFSPSLQTAYDAELEANQLARAELLAIQAGGLYAEEYGSDPYVGLVRHASGAITPPEPKANIEARYAILRALEAAGRR